MTCGKRSVGTGVLTLAGAMTLVVAGWMFVPLSHAVADQAQAQQPASPGATAKPVGTVKALSGNTMTLATDAGSAVDVVVQESTRIVRIAPGQKDLKDAAAIQLQDVQVG